MPNINQLIDQLFDQISLPDSIRKQPKWMFIVGALLALMLLILFPSMFTLLVLGGVAGFFLLRSSKALRESEERWKFALEGAGDGVWDWHVPTDQVIYSKQYKEIHGFNDEDIQSNTPAWQNRIHPDDKQRVHNDVMDCLEGRTPNYVNEHRICCKNGQIKWVLARGMVVSRDERHKAIRMIGTHTDITERKLMEERIRQLAHFDGLTNLPNRSLFTDRLQQALLQARRERHGVAVMFIDLDGFKPVNDRYGHSVGDQLLKQVASRLTSTVRTSDTVARLGGDEFVVLLSCIEQEESAEVVARKISNTLSTAFFVDKQELHIGASIGIAVYPEHAQDEKLLLINADIAMYHVKQNGGRGFIFYSPDMQNVIKSTAVTA